MSDHPASIVHRPSQINQEQLNHLQALFAQKQWYRKNEKASIAREIGMSENAVKHWFQQQRALKSAPGGY